MESPSEPAPSRLKSRIESLRERIVSLHESLSPAGPSLARRASVVAHQLEASNWSAAREGLHATGDVLHSHVTRTPSPASGDFPRRVQELLGQIQPLRTRLTELGKSSSLQSRPVDRMRWHQAQQLVELVDQMIKESQGTVRQQIALLPMWEASIERANELYARAASRSVWMDKRRYQVAAVREFYAQLLAGNRPVMSAVTELAGRILQDVDEEPYPDHLEAISQDPAELVAVHAVNVAHVVSFLAASDPVWRSHRLSLALAALFMDVGMLETCPEVLTSPGPLTLHDRSAVDRHAVASSLMAERVQGLDPSLVRAIGSHHERMDGTGYPSGRRGEEISVPARLLAAADVYVALRSKRSHRRPFTPREALTTTLTEAETGRLDLERTRGLLNLSLYPVGTFVELTTSEIAEVVATQVAITQPGLAAQPFVRIVCDRRGQPVMTRVFRNLATRPDTRVARTLGPEEVEMLGLNR